MCVCVCVCVCVYVCVDACTPVSRLDQVCLYFCYQLSGRGGGGADGRVGLVR